jgi:hypothetical protein
MDTTFDIWLTERRLYRRARTIVREPIRVADAA